MGWRWEKGGKKERALGERGQEGGLFSSFLLLLLSGADVSQRINLILSEGQRALEGTEKRAGP